MAKRKSVSVDEEYLIFLHDTLAANQAKLREILGESGAQTIHALSSDGVAKAVKRDNPALPPLEEFAAKVRAWGMDVSVTKEGDDINFSLKCPYAETVHPRLTVEKPVCPLNEYVLGAVRLEDAQAILQQNDLTRDGAKFIIRTTGANSSRLKRRPTQ